MDNNPTPFQAFLAKKKIDELALQRGKPEIYAEWQKLFPLMHEKSFTMQQLFRINPLRRKYPVKE